MFRGFSYEVIEGWEQLPQGYRHDDVDGVSVDSRDRVYLMTRGDARVIVYEPDGTFVMSWGEDIFTPRTHGITIGPDDSVYTVDDGDHTVRKFTPDGKPLMVIGTPGLASDTGYDIKKGLNSIVQGGLLLIALQMWLLPPMEIFTSVTDMGMRASTASRPTEN